MSSSKISLAGVIPLVLFVVAGPALAWGERYQTVMKDTGFFLYIRWPALYWHLLSGGPVRESLDGAGPWAQDREGNLFAVDGVHHRVIVVTREGRVYPLAGTGFPGFRDGPADRAMFAMGGRGYPTAGIGVDSRGNVYVADGYNNRIRRITRQSDGQWLVTTAAGGGSAQLVPGETAPDARAVHLLNPVTLMVDALDNVWFEAYALYKLTPDGRLFAHSFANDRGLEQPKVVGMAADRRGGVYAVSRQSWASQIWRITQDGRLQWLAGITDAEASAKQRRGEPVKVDGPAAEASIWSAGGVFAAPDGSAVYFGGGDEDGLRRYKDGRVSTLTRDGTWAELQDRRGGLRIPVPVRIDEAGRIYVAKQPWQFPDPDQWSAFRVLVPLE